MKRRSGEWQAALGRKAGPMKHRLEPRGGSGEDVLAEYSCAKENCGYPIAPRDLVEWMGLTYHRKCAPHVR